MTLKTESGTEDEGNLDGMLLEGLKIFHWHDNDSS